MKLLVANPLPDNPRSIMRRLSYGETPGYKGETSYARRLQGTPFPRLHAYFSLTDQGMEINLHLDQKGATYEGSRAHSGEYTGRAVEDEIRRMDVAIKQMRNGAVDPKPIPKKESEEKTGFWKSLFGG